MRFGIKKGKEELKTLPEWLAREGLEQGHKKIKQAIRNKMQKKQ